MSGNDPLPTGTPIGDWGFCDHKGCTEYVPVSRDPLLCDQHRRRNPGDLAEARDRSGVFATDPTGAAGRDDYWAMVQGGPQVGGPEVTDHDPMCPFSDTFGAPCMYCALITRVRADERENMDAYFASRSAEWEAKVRADQDNRECDHCTDLARLKIADLRAKVEALPAEHHYGKTDCVARADVLALLGDTDD